MRAAKAERESPLPDFGATVPAPPPHTTPQQPFSPPPVNEVQPPGWATMPVSSQTAGVVLPAQQGAPPPARRKSARKIGVGFILLLLFLMFLAFVLAIIID